jgi:hypothetical protein
VHLYFGNNLFSSRLANMHTCTPCILVQRLGVNMHYDWMSPNLASVRSLLTLWRQKILGSPPVRRVGEPVIMTIYNK